MRVPSNTTTTTLVEHLSRLSSQQSLLQTRVATGQRIFLPGDDPAAVGRVVSYHMEQGQLTQFQRNAEVALGISEATYSALKEIKEVSDRAGELATLGAGAASTDSMAAYAAEVNQLIEQSVTLVNARLRTDFLFAGTAVDVQPFTVTRGTDGKITGVAYAGNTDRLEVPLAEGATLAPGSSGATNAGLGDFINQLVALRDALGGGDAAAVNGLRPSLEASEDLLVSSLSEHGSVQLRIEVSKARQQSRLDELERLISSEADADITATVVELSQATTAYEAALASSADILKMSLLDYLR
ncbi:MAG TPA: flagellin [Opitutaceae bacterium]